MIVYSKPKVDLLFEPRLDFIYRTYITYFIAILNYEIDMNIIGNRGRSLK